MYAILAFSLEMECFTMGIGCGFYLVLHVALKRAAALSPVRERMENEGTVAKTDVRGGTLARAWFIILA